LIDHNLITQASRIDSAYITTFDAYSLALVKKYYFHLGVDKNITIMDQALLEVKKKEIVDAMFEKRYLNKDERFFSLLSKYTKQNDENVKKMILSILSKLELIVDEEEFCKQYEERYYTNSFIQGLVSQYEKLALSKVEEFYQALVKLADMASVDTTSQKLYEDVQQILSTATRNSYDDAYSWLSTITLPRINSKAIDYVKTQKAVCGELLKTLKLKYFSKYVFLADAENELYAIKEDVLYLLELALEVSKELSAYKYELMAFDYMDIAKMAIQLVKTNPIVLNEIKNSFTEILIDEYQDTSDIQETFISYISNQNCYMVGDIKQSIYRFRNANPNLFKEKY
ncbi:MAG: UvrD-helicase domain-containing protein, partial [Anaeroplasmataceae bacterium]|nr:UvrD-helicase domain-containing protein [Anaeroplasmataceae bacterium]